ncbi:MAG: hypothetical protein IJW29_06380 [Clostridia bacterium]|nr:hypothetical protein [Clostridia bacterium]
MSEKTCGTCQLAVEKYGDPTGTQLICRATAGHLRFAEDECDIYETDFETLCHKSKGGRMSDKPGICKTCRHHARGCKLNVVDRQRGRGAEPCGWWQAKRKTKEDA